MIIFKSKLYREEIKHWMLIVCLIIWALIATIFSFRNTSKTLVIGIDEAGSRLITESNDRLLQVELKQFFKYFLDQYYTYNQDTFQERVGLATELMSTELWEREKSKLLEIQDKLTKTPLIQFSELESLDLVDQNKVEAILKIKIKSRLNEQILKLRISLNFRKHGRSEKNPWNFEITELSDAVL